MRDNTHDEGQGPVLALKLLRKLAGCTNVYATRALRAIKAKGSRLVVFIKQGSLAQVTASFQLLVALAHTLFREPPRRR